jgi:hypothetical protein
VYGLLERNYQNKEMYKIDEYLALMNSLLILVQPTDLVRSSIEHGSDLTNHNTCFELLYDLSEMKKVKMNYENINSIVDDYLFYDNIIKDLRGSNK